MNGCYQQTTTDGKVYTYNKSTGYMTDDANESKNQDHDRHNL